MAKCPNCKKELKELLYTGEATITGSLELEGEWGDWYDDDPDYHSMEYKCPECKHVITHNDEEAVNFLKGE